jgi:hypothetical protein
MFDDKFESFSIIEDSIVGYNKVIIVNHEHNEMILSRISEKIQLILTRAISQNKNFIVLQK